MSANAPSQTVFSIGYDFHLGNGTSGADNGNVFGITNYKDNTRNQTFTYDLLNRLASAQNAGTNCAATTVNGATEYWGNSYGYDAWGNLLQKSVTKCRAENLLVTADAHNWIHASGTDYQYDAAGNMTFNATAPAQTYSYDQENRLTGAAGYAYTYDGDGNRVRKSNGNLAANGTLYWYMAPGVVTETDLAGTTKSEYVFFAGEHVARRDGATGTGAVFYYFSDHLKTASIVTDSAGVIKAESDYYPWGGELQFVNNDSNDYKFTGKKRDFETGLDYFGARYYSNGLGRFVSADRVNSSVAFFRKIMSNPQNLSGYQYANDEPLSKTDLGGFLTIIVPGTHWSKSDWNSSSAFYKQVGKTTGESPVILQWSGKLSGAARTQGAAQLAKLINGHTFSKGEKLTIVAHSHGSNVAFMASHNVNHKIDNLVTLGAPVRDDSMPDMNNISDLLNIWTPNDDVSFLGELSLWNGATHHLPGTDEEAPEASGHSDLWQNPNVWTNHVAPHLSTGGGVASGGGGGAAGRGSSPINPANQTSNCKTKMSNGPWHGC